MPQLPAFPQQGNSAAVGPSNQSVGVDPVLTMVKLAFTKSDELVLQLSKVFSKLEEEGPRHSRQEYIRSCRTVVCCICDCLAAQWQQMKAQYQQAAASVLREEKQDQPQQQQQQLEEEHMRMQQKLQSVMPPPLVEEAVRSLLQMVYTLFGIEELRPDLLRLVYFLSLGNIDLVAEKIRQDFDQLHEKKVGAFAEDDLLPGVHFLRSANLRTDNLMVVFQLVNGYGPALKKPSQWHCLAESVFTAIWKWIENYTTEFVVLWQKGIRFGGDPARIFDLFEQWSKKKGQPAKLWPAQIMLLVLCPDIVVSIAQDKDTEHNRFFQKVKKAMRAAKSPDHAAACLVHFCKASTYVSGRDSALRFMSPAIDEELLPMVLNTKSQPHSSDEPLMTELLVASFRLSPTKVSSQVIPPLLALEANITFQQAVIDALVVVAKEGAFLPWIPTIQNMYSSLVVGMRALFAFHVSGFQSYMEGLKSGDRKGKVAVDQFLPRARVLTSICNLLTHDPLVVLFPVDSLTDIRDVRDVLTGLCDAFSHFELPELSKAARECLVRLHKPSNMSLWLPHAPLTSYWEFGCAILASLAEVILRGRDLTTENVKQVVTLLERILSCRNEFVVSMKEKAPFPTIRDHVSLCIARLESALMVCLSSADVEVVNSAAQCLGLLCDENDILGADIAVSTSLAANALIYRKISGSISHLGGRVHQQKQFHNIFSRLDQQTMGNIAAWEELWERWNLMTSAFVATGIVPAETGAMSSSSSTSSSSSSGASASLSSSSSSAASGGGASVGPAAAATSVWGHTLGLLCALCGILEDRPVPRSVELHKTQIVQLTRNDAYLMTYFFAQVADLLVCDQVAVREATRTLVASSLSPLVVSSFLRMLHGVVRGLMDESGLTARRGDHDSTSLIDQVVGFLKLVLDRNLTQADLSGFTLFEDIMLCLARYIAQILVDKSPPTLQVRLKFCSLVESLCTHSNLVTWTNERDFREALVEIMVEWTTHFALKEPNVTASPRGKAVAPIVVYESMNAQVVKFVKDLDVALLSAVAKLLTGLELEGESSSKEEKFTKYFSFLTRVLRIARGDSGTPPKLPDLAIDALSALLASNTEAGLPYFVTMGYHKDVGLRTAFLQVLTTILKEGTSLDSFDISESRYSGLTELLLHPNMDLALALCESVPIAEADELAEVFSAIFESNGRIKALIKVSIAVELAKTSIPNTLFRRNSVTTKIMTYFARFAGQDYLQEALLPVVRALLTSNLTCELDPTKLPEGQSLEQNQQNVISLTKQVLERLDDTVHLLPSTFRDVCGFLMAAVERKFPEHGVMAVGGFMFLRFICPALVSQDSFGLIRSFPADVRRGLVLVAKTLQNLANMILFGSKEEFMTPLNPFIEANMPVVRALLTRYAKTSSRITATPALALSEEEKNISLERLHYYIGLNLEALHAALQRTAERQKVLVKLTAALAMAGPAPEHNPKKKMELSGGLGPRGARVTGQELKQLIQENKDKKVDVLMAAKVFYRGQNLSKRGNPVFYYNIVNWNRRCDCGLLLYHMVQTIMPCWGSPFELVVDMTDAKADNLMDEAWCARAGRLVPSDGSVLKNCSTLIIVNPNRMFKKFMSSRWLNDILPADLINCVAFVNNQDDLSKWISVKECNLQPSTLTLLTSLSASWSDLEPLNRGAKKRKTITLRLCKDVIQIVDDAPVDIWGGLGSPLVENIHVAFVMDATSNLEGTELYLHYRSRDGSIFHANFKTKVAAQICTAISAVRTRFEMAKPATIKTRHMTTSDVPGTLLNLAFLNLGSPDPQTRTAAYNLLTAVCLYFRYETAAVQLLEATGLCVPKTNNKFVVRLSTGLAKSVPSITLEFMMECMHGLVTASFEAKHLCLSYLHPWMLNLRSFFVSLTKDEPSVASKTSERLSALVKQFAQLSLKETEVRPAILAKIWKPLGKIREALDLTLENVIGFAASGSLGVYSDEAATMADAVVTMAAQNPQLVTGKLITRLMNTIRATSESANNVTDLAEHKLFGTMALLTRFLLMLSFDNLIDVQHYLPEIVYICCMLFAHGDWVQRITVHRLLVNVVHAAYLLQKNVDLASEQRRLGSTKSPTRTSSISSTSTASPLMSRGSDASVPPPNAIGSGPAGSATNTSAAGAKLAGVADDHAVLLYLRELDDPRTKVHFGFGQHLSLTPFSNPVDARKKGPPGRVPIESAQAVAVLVRHIVDALGPGGRAVGTVWYSRCLEFMRESAMTSNSVLQPRAMVMLGSLLNTPQLCADQVVEQILGVLQKSFGQKVDAEPDLQVSVLLTLSMMIPHLPRDTGMLKPLFWLGTTLLHLDSQPIFSASLSLLDACVKTADARSLFDNSSVEDYFMSLRKLPGVGQCLMQIDKEVGVSFATNFSFSFCTGLLKGIKSAKTKTATLSLLSSMLNIGSNFLKPDGLGYLAALLPFKSLEKVGSRDGRQQFLWTREVIPNETFSVLLFSVWVSLLKQGKGFESETQTIYVLLEEGIRFEPLAISGTYLDLLPQLREVVQSSKDNEIVASALGIMEQMFSINMTKVSDKALPVQFLKDLNFKALHNTSERGLPLDAVKMLVKCFLEKQ